MKLAIKLVGDLIFWILGDYRSSRYLSLTSDANNSLAK